MSTVTSYLTFNGNCREAMTFYNRCLGGRLKFQTFGESDTSGKMPSRMKKCILHAELRNEKLLIMASDMVDEGGLLRGNSISLMLNCSSENEIRECYHTLSEGGEQTYPLRLTAWNAIFGGLTDKYGNHWMLNFQEKDHYIREKISTRD